MSKFTKIHHVNDIKNSRILTLYKWVCSLFLDKSKWDFFLVSSIFFYNRKIYLLFFFCSYENLLKACVFLKECNPIRDLSPQVDYFSPSVIWASLNTKIFEKARSICKKYENFYEEIVFLFKNRKQKIQL